MYKGDTMNKYRPQMTTLTSSVSAHNVTDLAFQVPMQTGGVISRPATFEHTIYIDEELVSPSEWRQELETIRSAQEGDYVHLRINSAGGSDVVMGAFVKAIAETQAHVVGHIEHMCCSAATIIFLACHSYVVSDDCEFMVHTASLGYGGKQNNFYEFSTFNNKANERLMKKYYKDFLTEDEISQALKGADFWFDSEEVIKRLENRDKIRQESQIEEMKKCGCEECKQTLSMIAPDSLDLEDFLDEEYPTREELETWNKEDLIDFILGEDIEDDSPVNFIPVDKMLESTPTEEDIYSSF
ncbi:MAG: hypothetical protein EOM41_00735 [Bacilli bacterium]|nr:hypothetical protein [Bacilli bacterium]